MKYYILPFRDLVVSPGMTVPALIDNPMSVTCIKTAITDENSKIVLVPQHSWSYPTAVEDIYSVGTIGDVIQILNMPDGAMHIIVKTTNAVSLRDVAINNGIFTCDIDIIPTNDDMND